MIATLEIRGLGPVRDPIKLTLNADGPTTIVGPSAVGKTSLIRALTFCLWGLDVDGKAFPAESISGEDVCVQITTARGSRIVRSMTPARRTERVFQRAGGEPEQHDTEDAFRRALGPFGRDVKALLLIVAPQAWVPLALGEGGGRPLRDVIASVGPSMSIRTRVAALMAARGLVLLDRDPADSLDPKLAETARANANRRRDEAAGSLKAVRERLAAAQATAATGPTPEAVAAAREVLAAVETWRVYLAAKSSADTAQQARREAVARHAAWEARKAAIPVEPTPPIPTLAMLNELRAKRDRALLDPDLDDAEAKVKRYTEEAKPTGPDRCVTCGQSVAPSGAPSSLAVGALASATSYRDALLANRDTRRIARLGDLEQQVAAMEKAIVDWHAFNAACAALGVEPTIPPEVATPPEPTVPRPVNAKADADATIAAAERGNGADAERARNLEDARRNVETAEKASQLAEAEAVRLDGLVAAVRAAPSVIAEEAIASLGPIAPLSLELEPAGGIRVRVDRWDWPHASTGRLIAGDFAFRVGLRRALGVPTLPIFVDSVQSAGCELVEADGPVVYLLTDRDATGIVARPGGPR